MPPPGKISGKTGSTADNSGYGISLHSVVSPKLYRATSYILKPLYATFPPKERTFKHR